MSMQIAVDFEEAQLEVDKVGEAEERKIALRPINAVVDSQQAHHLEERDEDSDMRGMQLESHTQPAAARLALAQVQRRNVNPRKFCWILKLAKWDAGLN